MSNQELQPLEIEPISKRTYDTISRAIIRGALAPGSALSDRKLADQLGISRTPVREALHMLENSGLIARGGRTGWTVTDFGESEIRELYQLRRLFESAGFDSIESWSDEFAADLLDVVEATKPSRSDEMEPVIEADRRLHRQLVEASSNSRLIEFYEVVSAQIDRIRYFVPMHDRDRLMRSYAEHKLIVTAVANRDPQSARAALVDHIISAEEAMLALL